MENDKKTILPIESYLGDDGIEGFKNEVATVANRYHEIIGVLAVGSMVQSPPPNSFYNQKRSGLMANAYESIRRPERRKQFCNSESDLDIWVCTRDNELSRSSRLKVEMGGVALLSELASSTIKRGTPHWRDKKISMFGDYYKNRNLYHSDDLEPWMANDFKNDLEYALVHNMSDFVKNVSLSMNKSIPGNFLEVRAYPESLFHLRPDESTLANGTEDRAPFPRIIDEQWLSTDHNAYILYDNGANIYPFKKNGDRLGSLIDNQIKLMSEREISSTSVGGIMLKPDAVESNYLQVIRQKIQDRLDENCGRIILEKKIDKLTEEQIKSIYPFMPPEDFVDLKEYLQSGSVIIILVELPTNPYKAFSIVNSIKGPRIGDRTVERLYEGRREDLAIRDLLPFSGDEEKYLKLIYTILGKRSDPKVRFDKDDYNYYARNLIHTPDNCIDLNGLINIVQ